MENIQFGIDIATSLSVIGATVLFLRNGKKLRASALRNQRIERMSEIILDFSIILQEGDDIVRRIRLMQAGRDESVNPDDLTKFCTRIESQIRIKTACLFKVWATEAEMSVINGLWELVKEWNENFVKATNEREKGNQSEVPSFNMLIDNLTLKVTEFSNLLRQEVEKSK